MISKERRLARARPVDQHPPSTSPENTLQTLILKPLLGTIVAYLEAVAADWGLLGGSCREGSYPPHDKYSSKA